MNLLIPKITLVLNALIVLACAKEVSDEEKRREENNRSYERLNSASGIFDGYVVHDAQTGVPATLAVVAKRNPTSGNETPLLEVTLQLGLFGGVTLTAGDAAFDWGTGLLTAKFPRATGAGGAGAAASGVAMSGQSDSLELRARIEDDTIADVTLIGPRSGQHEMVMSLREKQQSVSEREYQLALNMRSQQNGDRNVPAVLSLRRHTSDVKAPLISDLPLLPPLDASIRFQTLADAPQRAVATYYDPLTGTLDAIMSDTSTVTLNRLFVPIDAATQKLSLVDNIEVSGAVSIASKNAGNIKAIWSPGKTALTDELGGTPPRSYIGTYRGTNGGRTLRTIGNINVFGTTTENPQEYGFNSFPTMRLNLYICVGGRVQEARVYTAYGFDYLNSRAYLGEDRGAQGFSVQMDFSPQWQTLDGYITAKGTPRTGDPGANNAEFHLRVVGENEAASCQTEETVP